MKSSLTFQLSLYLGSYVIALFAILEVTIMIYKFVVLPMPSLNVFLEVLVLLGFCMCEALRIFFAKKGNLTESATDTGISILLLVPAVLGVVFFMVWQTYVLRLEVVVCGVTLAMQIVHALFSFICLVTFYNRTH